ncbi:YqcC family protein [Thalassomonas viridans]|uniref:YqcC family protein n=1 Tax=Thalassomonas viridans TaxID=137584 RepID=A0AAE9Z5D9_9GAMM|nr:YqcC family protein [Thalassomonas viridans]WDE06918.1 YqcC family protein [Thalassomonas viridans]
MKNSLHQDTLVLLSRLAAELKRQQLWQASDVPAGALASRQPFCCDTLTFAQWLQFVFIPKLGQLAENNLPLPADMALCPMAEEAFKDKGQLVDELINIIGDLDELLSGKRAQTMFVKPL